MPQWVKTHSIGRSEQSHDDPALLASFRLGRDVFAIVAVPGQSIDLQ